MSERVAGTYLLCGPDGCGRWLTALSFTALLNCEKPGLTEGEPAVAVPCGECRNCRVIFELNHEGLYFAMPLPPHKNEDQAIELTNEVLSRKREEPFAVLSSSANLTIPISVGRRIKRDIGSRPAEGVYRAVIFYQMERMRPEAADALLKMIEEPPPRAVILLIAERSELLLPTIQSRSQRVILRSSPYNVVADYLVEKHEVERERAALLSRVAEGIAGRAVEMAENDAEGAESRRMTGLALFRSVYEESPPDTVDRIVQSVGERNRGEGEYLLHLWQSLLRDCTHLAVTGDEEGIVNVDFAADLKRLSSRFADPGIAAKGTDHIKITLEHFRRNVHIHGALTSLVLKMKADIA